MSIERLILLYWKLNMNVRLHVHVPGRKLLLLQTDANSYAGNFFFITAFVEMPLSKTNTTNEIYKFRWCF